MENVSRGTLQGEVEVEDFIDWVNEIHRWGLTVYGKACEADVKGCIDRGPSGIQTSSAITIPLSGETSSIVLRKQTELSIVKCFVGVGSEQQGVVGVPKEI